MDLLEELESTPFRTHLQKAFQNANQRKLDFLQKSFEEDRLDLLLGKHFPGNTSITEAGVGCLNLGTPSIRALKEDELEWAVNTYKPYKSPGSIAPVFFL